MMMLPVLRRCIVAMVVIIRCTQQRVMNTTVRNASMLHRHVPGGKEPAKQRQQSEDSGE